MVEKIKALCDKGGTTIKALEKELRLGNGSIRRWDETAPSVDKVLLVSRYFGVTVEWLKSEETPPTPEGEGLSEPWIIEAISLLRQLRPENQKQVFDFAQALLKIQESAGGQSQKDF